MKCQNRVILIACVSFLSGNLVPLASQSLVDLFQYSEIEDVSPTFHYLGWSKNGKFAYAIQSDSSKSMKGGETEYFETYVIFDAVEDKGVWSTTDALGELNEDDLPNAFDISWKRNSREILKKFSEFGVILSKETGKLQDLPLHFSNSVYEVHDQIDHQNEDNESLITHIKLQIQTPKLGTKVIHDREIEGYFLPNDFDLLGCFLSPFEPRAIVVYRTSGIGFEFEHVEDYFLVGAHLQRGFKK